MNKPNATDLRIDNDWIMIKSNELRCGNLVGRKYWNPHPTEPSWMIEVETVVEIRMAKVLLEDRHKQRCKMNYESIEPIPLTEEWHVKFGANKVPMAFEYAINDYKYIVFIGDYVYLRDFSIDRLHPTIDDDVCTLWNKDIKKRDMYVHEWQNLYFALTQTELTPSDGGKIE